MDALSQILQATRARSPVIANLQLGRDVSIGLPALGGVPFHYVAKGTCELVTDHQAFSLREGDFVMLSRVPYYRLQTGSGADRVEAMEFAEQDSFSKEDLLTGRDQLLRRQFGDGPIQTRIFSAILILGHRETSSLLRDLPPVIMLRDTKTMLEPWLAAAVEFMSGEEHEAQPGISAIAERLIETIFIAMLRKWLLDGKHEQGWMRGLTDPAISLVLKAMHGQPGRRWTLSALAQVSGCSRSGLAKHFREVMGETPFGYLARWRMDLAAAALARGERSTADLGARLGYGGAAALTRMFRVTFGETPALYRRRHQR